eukprot:TRINITY_DN15854_c0_g1_i1.p1 TRINITY_DN15854_c0_g1~~TRINITY_DN15854_c0_g1_i1.p1  ORF type:complete len:434 (+),score=128.98 TRINITY_DN15854_c0_g1_i1:68-1303(+)
MRAAPPPPPAGGSRRPPPCRGPPPPLLALAALLHTAGALPLREGPRHRPLQPGAPVGQGRGGGAQLAGAPLRSGGQSQRWDSQAARERRRRGDVVLRLPDGHCGGGELTPESVSRAPPDCIRAVPETVWLEAEPDVVAAISPAAFAGLPSTSCAAFNRHQGRAMRAEQLARISPECFAALGPDALQSLRPAAFAAIPPAHIRLLTGDVGETIRAGDALRGMTAEQCRYLRGETCGSMEGDWLEKVPPEACAGLNLECFEAMAIDADGIPPECFRRFSPVLFARFPKVSKFCYAPPSSLRILNRTQRDAIPKSICTDPCLDDPENRGGPEVREILGCNDLVPSRPAPLTANITAWSTMAIPGVPIPKLRLGAALKLAVGSAFAVALVLLLAQPQRLACWRRVEPEDAYDDLP